MRVTVYENVDSPFGDLPPKEVGRVELFGQRFWRVLVPQGDAGWAEMCLWQVDGGRWLLDRMTGAYRYEEVSEARAEEIFAANDMQSPCSRRLYVRVYEPQVTVRSWMRLAHAPQDDG